MIEVAKVPFDTVLSRARQNCKRDGNAWRPVDSQPTGKFRRRAKLGISESRKRAYISDAEQEILREMEVTVMVDRKN